MVKAVTATATKPTITKAAQADPKSYQQGTMPGFELVAPLPTLLFSPVLDEDSNHSTAQGGDHAILTSIASDKADNPTDPNTTTDPARPSRILKAKTTRARAKRGSWPAGVPVAQGYSIYAFYKHQPDNNVLREYRLEYAPSL